MSPKYRLFLEYIFHSFIRPELILPISCPSTIYMYIVYCNDHEVGLGKHKQLAEPAMPDAAVRGSCVLSGAERDSRRVA